MASRGRALGLQVITEPLFVPGFLLPGMGSEDSEPYELITVGSNMPSPL